MTVHPDMKCSLSLSKIPVFLELLWTIFTNLTLRKINDILVLTREAEVQLELLSIDHNLLI